MIDPLTNFAIWCSTFMSFRKGFKIGRIKNFSETFAMLAVLFVELQTLLDNHEYLFFSVNSRQLSGQAGMAAEFASQLDPVASAAFGDGAGGAGLHAFAAVQTAVHVDLRYFFLAVQRDRIFFAGFNTGLLPI